MNMELLSGMSGADNRRTRGPSVRSHSRGQAALQTNHPDGCTAPNDEDEDTDAFEDAQESWFSDTASSILGLSRQISYDPSIASASSPPPSVPSRSSTKSYISQAPSIESTSFVANKSVGGLSRVVEPSRLDYAEVAGDTQYPQKCEVCEKYRKAVLYCNVCKSSFCETCWNAQFVHKKTRGGVLHERTDPAIAQKVHNVLSPPTGERERERLYKADEGTAWFGIERPEDNSPPVFQDYGRFSDLMGITDPLRRQPSFLEQWTQVERDRRTPSLVSFVGQTGAGKSTLVKLLVDFSVNGIEQYSTPVVGPRGAHLPSSEDVHLYLDPRTADSLSPLLYADCEGLEGGEREPLGAKFKKKYRMNNSRLPDDEQQRHVDTSGVVSERELEWASGPRSSTREFAVTNLYPRLLYTFSDVIVFVLRNPRTIEQVFVQLVKWAASAIETSSNQPVLPHAIIALNASEYDIHPYFWDVRYNTETILEDLANTVNRNDTFKKWSQFWRERGKTINNLEELLLCYYSSVQIIRLPTEGRPKLMAEQIEKLYSGTLSACVASRSARHSVRMLLDVDDLQAYLQDAFNHYCSTLESPFDFVQASFRHSPIPQDFGGNILKLALSMVDLWEKQPQVTARRIFSELSYVVASCIMLDSARNKNKGNASQIIRKYKNHLDDAMQNFCNQHWRCEFVDPRTGVRCVNVRSGHSAKGHQSTDGKVFATGEYVSSWSWEENENEFPNKVYHCFVELFKELTDREPGIEGEEQAAAGIHKNSVLRHFFRRATRNGQLSTNSTALSSHTACFCCLFGQADHFLPCGHVICTECLHTYGKTNGATEVEISGCPIEGDYRRYSQPWIVHLKPKSAGVRILTLDGGGVRGTVELEVLFHIQKFLGNVPIQCFFDLIVGTSTGGVVALGLGTRNWTIQECIDEFLRLCHGAFTQRSGTEIPLIGAFVENYHHSKYQTSTLENALISAFSHTQSLFGGVRPASSSTPAKVAVTTTSISANTTYLLANYNHPRASPKQKHYHFQRPETSSSELKVWEAARATTAAPRYFKSFHHAPSRKTYIDGAVFHSNPIRLADSERKILWPDHSFPDIFLSLGTGYSVGVTRAESEHLAAARRGIFNHGRTLYKILRSNMDQTLDCERTWEDYFSTVANSLPRHISTSRFIRINPEIGQVPALDEKDKMLDLRRRTNDAMCRDPRIEEIGRQLIATSFYFELLDASEGGQIVIAGKLQCRLAQGSQEMFELGLLLKKRSLCNEVVSFVVYVEGDVQPIHTILLTDHELDTMISRKRFDLGRRVFSIKSKIMPVHIDMYFGCVSKHPISGFPRSFFDGDTNASSNGASHKLITSSMSARYTHGSRRARSGGVWQPQDLAEKGSLSNLKQYANPTRTLGDDGLDDWVLPKMPKFAESPVYPDKSANVTSPQARRSGIRDAFRALLIPLNSRRADPDQQTPLSPTTLPVYELPEAGFSEAQEGKAALDEKLSIAHSYYNVPPEDYAVYRQWVNLLQPNDVRLMKPWAPSVGQEPPGYSTENTQGSIFEMAGDTMFPVEMETNYS